MTVKEIEKRINKFENLGGMTVNERLYMTGLFNEFDNSCKHDKEKAKIILKLLGVDQNSIDEIVT